MKRFATLFERLDSTTSTNARVQALVDYFAGAEAADAVWAIYFLSGRKLKRLVATAQLREAIQRSSGIPPWLFEECYSTVGDLAETIALLAPGTATTAAAEEGFPLHRWIEERLLPLGDLPQEKRGEQAASWWPGTSTRELFLLNKLLTGGFRTGVSQALIVRALAKYSGLTEARIAHRMMGSWDPSPKFFKRLCAPLNEGEESSETSHDPGIPYPFFLASPLEKGPESLATPGEWLVEWKWDGIRAQAIHREGGVFLWSRGEELITDRFPEIIADTKRLPLGTVLDGEILAVQGDEVLSFNVLQQRIGRKKVTAKILADIPVRLMAFDLLELQGKDLRAQPLSERRSLLKQLLSENTYPAFRLSPQLEHGSWDALAQEREKARERKVEGLMIKRLTSSYAVGRKRGDWWKWKVDPYVMDAVLLYAQAGHGRRATLYTDYTFGVWKGEELVPVAKAYSGLTDAEILVLDRWIRKHTIEKFGPVRSLEPELVFELAFEGIAPSPRHKAGIAVRFPRILRQRTDKKPKDADSVEQVKALLHGS